MLICRVDTSPFLGLFDEFEATWCIHPLFRLENPWDRPRRGRAHGFGRRKSGWIHHVASNSSKSPKNGDVSTQHIIIKPNYHTMKLISENLSIIEMKKVKVKMKKPIYFGLSILEISKIIMYEFWYDYIKRKYGKVMLYGH